MQTFYIVGLPRNQDGTLRKNGKRKVLDIEHTLEKAKIRAEFWKKDQKYDIRIFTGGWKEIIEKE